MEKCCENCFIENEIINYIKTSNVMSACPYCDSTNVFTMDVRKVGKFIRKGLDRAYEDLNEGTGAVYDPEDKVYLDGSGRETEGSSVSEILLEEIAIFSSITREEILLKDLFKKSAPSDRDIQKGERDNYSNIDERNLAFKDDLYGVETNEQYNNWELFKYVTKFYNRYFDVDDRKQSRDQLLSDVSMVFSYMEETLKKGERLYRARKMEINESFSNTDFYKELSPAPSKHTTNNRMSPQGISYTYLSTIDSTCFKECRMELGDTALVGLYEIKKDLKILNLSKMMDVHLENSIFSQNYKHDLNWIHEFIELFSSEISKPIKDEEKGLEYVPTQVMAEFIRMKNYDGIKFRSSISKNTYNYTLFCGPNWRINKDYKDLYSAPDLIGFNRWLKLISVEYVQLINPNLDKHIISVCEQVRRKDMKYTSNLFLEFDCMDDIRDVLIELNSLLEEKYNIYMDGIKFNLLEYVRNLLLELPDEEHFISVHEFVYSIKITLDNRTFDFDDIRGFEKAFDESILLI